MRTSHRQLCAFLSPKLSGYGHFPPTPNEWFRHLWIRALPSCQPPVLGVRHPWPPNLQSVCVCVFTCVCIHQHTPQHSPVWLCSATLPPWHCSAHLQHLDELAEEAYPL